MERILVSEVKNYVGKEILLKGWIHQIRPLSKFSFILLRDRTGIIQTIVTDLKSINVSELERESAIELWGKVKAEKQAPDGIEVEVTKINVISKTVAPLPFEVNRTQEMLNLKIDMILDHRPFSLRNPEIGSVFRVQAEICRTFAEFMRQQGFLEVHTSKIIAQGTEGGTALFPIQYFEQKAYLAQSPQFYKQMLVGAGYERVFEIGFVYRAEDHATSRHINEYLSLDYEMGFIDSHQDVMKLEVEFLRRLFNNLKTNCAQELSIHKITLPEIKEIPQIPLLEAMKIIQQEFGREPARPDDLDPDGEKMVCEYAAKKYGSEFVYITNYPVTARPFYTMPDLANPGLTKSFDLLYKGLEVTTGSQRIHDYNMLVDNIKKFKMNPAAFDFYLEIFRYGMPPHGGLAIGTERLTQQILNLKNVREASLFPRDRYRLTP
jgi:nondiscriminating aspartyl-tRNA synthetase